MFVYVLCIVCVLSFNSLVFQLQWFFGFWNFNFENTAAVQQYLFTYIRENIGATAVVVGIMATKPTTDST